MREQSQDAVRDHYHPFDVRDAARYAATCPPLDTVAKAGGTIEAREVGDGNLNLVFIVTSDRDASCVIKQALPYVRLVGESWPLTIDRNRLEREATELYAHAVPDLLPRIYHADPDQALFVMEDLSRLRIVRGGLVSGERYPRLARDIARFSAETLVRTSDFYLDGCAKKRLVRQFINPELCKITEDLVLTDPFYDAASNSIEPANRAVVEELWADGRAQTNIAALRYAFITRAEALLHGDLHTGSVMGSVTETKVMDAEFAFFGPIGFDIGMFTANLLISAIAHRAQGHDRALVRALLDAAVETWREFHGRVEVLLDQAPVWKLPPAARGEYMQAMLRDAIGYCGAEMIRRTIGLARVSDLESIADAEVRARAKATTITVGRALVNSHLTMDRFEQALSTLHQATETNS